MDISELKVGEVVVGPELLQNVCPEKVEMVVDSVKKGPTMSAAVFLCKYKGISLGKVTAYFDGKTVQWGVLS